MHVWVRKREPSYTQLCRHNDFHPELSCQIDYYASNLKMMLHLLTNTSRHWSCAHVNKREREEIKKKTNKHKSIPMDKDGLVLSKMQALQVTTLWNYTFLSCVCMRDRDRKRVWYNKWQLVMFSVMRTDRRDTSALQSHNYFTIFVPKNCLISMTTAFIYISNLQYINSTVNNIPEENIMY